MNDIAIELKGIDKKFGLVHANKNINMSVRKGTIHGIIGENGAGKSTLMSILYGFYQAGAGDIFVDGKKTVIKDPNAAIAAGIGMVHQHFMLVENFTVLENIMLGAEESQVLNAGITKARQELKRLEQEYELDVDPDAIIEELPVGLQQRVEILKALYRGAEILILDEPTGVLTPAEADHLFRILEQLKSQGKTILLITHKLREIMAVTDEVSVMRRGEMVATRTTAETSVEELAELMVGRHVLLQVDKGPATPGEVMLSVENLSMGGLVRNSSFSVYEGQVTGMFGLVGSGRTEMMKVVAGVIKRDFFHGGQVRLFGRPIRYRVPAPAIRDGIVYVTEERKQEGFFETMSIAENIHIGQVVKNRGGGFQVMSMNSAREAADTWRNRLNIRAINPDAQVIELSGGNQQKVVIAKALIQKPRLVIFDEPTRGVDVGTIAEIHAFIKQLADDGIGVVVISSYLPEVLAISDRILIARQGKIVEEMEAGTATEESIMYAAVH